MASIVAPVSDKKSTAVFVVPPTGYMLTPMSSPAEVEPMMMLPGVSGFDLFFEQTLLKWPVLPQQPHSFPLAGHSNLGWDVSDPQFQHTLGGAPAGGLRRLR